MRPAPSSILQGAGRSPDTLPALGVPNTFHQFPGAADTPLGRRTSWSARYRQEDPLTRPGVDPYAVGWYATGNKVHGIRNYAMDWPSGGILPTPSTQPKIDPLNFSDIGYDTPGPPVLWWAGPGR